MIRKRDNFTGRHDDPSLSLTALLPASSPPALSFHLHLTKGENISRNAKNTTLIVKVIFELEAFIYFMATPTLNGVLGLRVYASIFVVVTYLKQELYSCAGQSVIALSYQYVQGKGE